MTLEEKNQYIEQYIRNKSTQVNSQYGKNLIDDDKIVRAITMFKDSDKELDVIKDEIDKLALQIIEEYIEFQKKIEEMIRRREEQLSELATLNIKTEKDGIYLSQQQVDLLMIVNLNSKEELKNYVENICGQFPNRKVEDVIPNYDTMQLEDAKKRLFEEYQKGLISYLDNATMTDKQKAEVKLKRLGINGEELEKCLKDIEDGKINETFNYLCQKYGNDFITKFNHSMNDDFENIKSISYEEMKSLSELIQNDKSMDTIIIATGKYDNSIYPTLNGKVFDPYLTNKALQFCLDNGKHMRYHALFDQAHVEKLLKQGKGLQEHDEILSEMKAYVKMSLDFIEKNNKQLPDGTMLINTVEVFNELVEKNRPDKDSVYAMVWEKYFGITVDEIMECFPKDSNGNYIKPNGIEFMYNETTLTESSQKRSMIEKVLYQIEQKQAGFIDTIGDQMHLSDEDLMTEEGLKNLIETAQMLKRFQDGKVIVDGQIKEIKPKKTECTEHDFHFTNHFLENVNRMKEKGQKVDEWSIKRCMQDIISDVYNSNGVKFVRSTYWSLFGKNDHNVVRENIKIQKENIERRKNGIKEKPLIQTMFAGLIPDGKKFNEVKSLKKSSEQQKNINKASILSKKRQVEINNLKKQRFELTQQQMHSTIQKKKEKTKTLKLNNNSNNGFLDVILGSIITIIIGFIIYMIIK